MKINPISLTKSDIESIWDYNPISGELVWKKRFPDIGAIKTFNKNFAGKVAGNNLGDGYRILMYKNKNYLVHRLVWILKTGSDTAMEIDHIDGNKSNNTMENLREATRPQNCVNTRVSSKSKTGIKGVSYETASGKYKAQININGKQKFLGYFSTAHEAKRVYDDKARTLHGEFYNKG